MDVDKSVRSIDDLLKKDELSYVLNGREKVLEAGHMGTCDLQEMIIVVVEWMKQMNDDVSLKATVYHKQCIDR